MVDIRGVIGEDVTYVGFLANLEEEKKKNPDNTISISVDSPGGYVDTGLQIYYTLLNLKAEGYRIQTKSVNTCASIASVIFAAGDQRIASCPIMIHNPYVAGEIIGDAKAISEKSKELQAIENELKEIYSTQCTLDADTLSYLMDNETYISPLEAVSLGFATSAESAVMAMYVNPNKVEQTIKTMAKNQTTWAALKDKMKAALTKNEIKAMALETVSGTVLTVEREEGTPQVGDAASPDGVHELPEGMVVTVVDGIITDITEIATEEAPIPEDVAELIDELITENSALKAQIKSEDDKKILNAVKLAGGIDKLLSGKASVKSAYVASKRSTASVNVEGSELLQSKLAAAKERLTNKKMK